jgi:hypothetical protein
MRRLEHWKAAVVASGIAELMDFVAGLADDAEAVVNGCSESWSNGMVARIHQHSEVDQTELLWTSRIPVAPAPCEARILLPEKHIAQRKPWLLNQLYGSLLSEHRFLLLSPDEQRPPLKSCAFIILCRGLLAC